MERRALRVSATIGLTRRRRIATKQLLPGLHQVKLGPVNVYLIDEGEAGLTLVDVGFEKNAAKIETAIRGIGREPADVTNILITHAHPDHLGSAAHFESDNTTTTMHAIEAEIARSGRIEQTMSPGPGLLNGILFRLLIGSKSVTFPPVAAKISVQDGDTLDIAGGIEVVHTPGHTGGHVAFLWRRDGGILFAGDVASKMTGFNYSLGYNDLATAKTSLARLGRLDFDTAVFGHGNPIMEGAASRFAKKWPS